MRSFLKVTLFFGMSTLLVSCVNTNSGISVTDQVLQIQEDNKKLIAEHQERIKKAREQYTKSAALTVPVKPPVKKKTVKKRPKVKKASVGQISRPAGRITERASLRCSPNELKAVIYQVARKFGHVVVNSTYRSNRRNRIVGGARRSYHLHCRAIDFRVRGNNRGLYRYLRNHPYVGGLKRYRSGFYHIDNGPRRSW